MQITRVDQGEKVLVTGVVQRGEEMPCPECGQALQSLKVARRHMVQLHPGSGWELGELKR
jgi:hypothetical protein